MKSIMLSVQPKWAKKILNGEKTIEIRKSAPKELPIKVYVYCTKDRRKNYFNLVNHYGQIMFAPKSWDNILNGKVVAEFVCMNVETFNVGSLRCDDIEKLACLTYKEMVNYFYKPIELNGNTQKWGKALHITDLKIYDEPKELEEFGTFCKDFLKCENIACYKDACEQGFIPLTRPPQSWMYCEELD